MGFDERAALITGGGTGVGQATARLLLEAGASLFIIGRRSDVLEGAATVLDPHGERVGFRATDVRDTAAVDAAVAATIERFGHLDALINAAGHVPPWSPIHETSDESWTDALDINLTGAFRVTRAALPHLVERRGAVVNVSSISAFKGANSVASYAAAKAGLVAFTRSVAAEYGPQGVRCNCVVPSWVTTPMTASLLADPAARAAIGRRHALHRVAEPDEVAHLIVFLLDEGASFLTGGAYAADGGMAAL